jgi:hypothetical protein
MSGLSGWYFNPFMGMYSYVPGMGGMFYSPYGNAFFSPFDVYMAFAPGFYYPGYGYGYGYGSPGYGGAYNLVNYKSVPVPVRSPGSSGVFRSGGSTASSHGPSTGSTAPSSSNSFPTIGTSTPGISHAGGGAASNSPHH